MTKQRAKQTASAVKKGSHTARKSKIWTKVTFKKPRCATQARDAIAPKRSVKKESTWDKYAIVKYSLSSESAIKTIEDHNTLVFVVDKKAYVVLSKVHDALEIANKKAYVVLSKVHDALE